MHASFIEIYNTNDMHKRFNDLNRDGKERIKGFLDYSIRLKVKKSISELSKIEKKLRNDFPNFTPAIDHVFASLKIGAGSDTKGVYFSPLLMVGPPGIGKTYFSKRLSKDLGLVETIIDLATATHSMILTGTSSRWGESSPGLIAKSLMKTKVANQVVRLDELDKVSSMQSTGFGGGMVTDALITLLEKHSAETFIDEWMEVKIDASHISYIATANSLDTMPNHILSRFNVAKIRILTKEEMLPVISNAYNNLLEEWELPDFTRTLGRGVKPLLAGMQDVRSLRAVLTAGLASCIGRNAKQITVHDVKASIADLVQLRAEKNNSMGFIH